MAKRKCLFYKPRRWRKTAPAASAAAEAAATVVKDAAATAATVVKDAAAATATPIRKKRVAKKKTRTKAIKEICFYKNSTNLLIPSFRFIRQVRNITNAISSQVTSWTAESLVALQEAAEDYLVGLFSEALLCANHAKRVTLTRQDLKLARRTVWKRLTMVKQTRLSAISYLSHP